MTTLTTLTTSTIAAELAEQLQRCVQADATLQACRDTDDEESALAAVRHEWSVLDLLEAESGGFVRAAKALGQKEWDGNVSGAWFTHLTGNRVWTTRFAGTHQRVRFTASGRTAGRSLRSMRRRLEREQIPLR